MDYLNWHIVLNSRYKNYQITDRERRMIFRPSWRTSAWLRQARREPGSVQLVAPHLDLRAASRAWVRKEPTRRHLVRMGFVNVMVQRVPVSRR